MSRKEMLKAFEIIMSILFLLFRKIYVVQTGMPREYLDVLNSYYEFMAEASDPKNNR